MEFSKDYSDFDENQKKKLKFEISPIITKRILVIIFFLLFALCLPVLLYLDTFDESKLPPKIEGVCLLDDSYRISCGSVNISEANCSKIFCCFEKKTNSCYHQEPSSYFYYEKNFKDSIHFVPSQEKTPIGLPSVKEVKMNYFEDGDILRVYLNDTRLLTTQIKGDLKNFDILKNENKKLSITVYRKNTTEMLLTTLKGPLIVNENYLEWTVQLTNSSGVLFGLGQLKLDSKENSTVKKIIYKNQDDHNTLPMFMAYNNGKYHAVIIYHEGLLEVEVLPSYLIYLKTLYTGGIQIQIIDGPTPKEIYDKIRKQQEEPAVPPEWIFGLHICREEPSDLLSEVVNQYNSFAKKNKNYPNFVYESDCIHDDLLLHILRANYTSDETTQLIKNLGLTKFILSFPPQIPIYSNIFQKFQNKSIFYANEKDKNCYVGKYKKMPVVYPIYNLANAQDLIDDILELFQKVTISGFTLTNSWPQDDSYQMMDKKNPLITEDIQEALSYTIPWNMPEKNDIHARYHNEYGSIFSDILEKKFGQQTTFSPVSNYNRNRLLIIQNVNTTWTNLKKSLELTLFNSLFGRNFLATPVCGSNFYDDEEQEDLCLRWYLVAATMPLLRVSSIQLPRSPTNLHSNYTINKVINILDIRRSLIPYYRAIIKNGSPIIRPMFFNFPDDKNLHSMNEQYMIGDGILVAQPMTLDIQIMSIYLPPNKVWYEIWAGKRYQTEKGKERIRFPIVKSDWVSFILEGNIIPFVNTTSSGVEISLIIALKCNDNDCNAEGSLLTEELGDELIKISYSGTDLIIDPPTVKKKNVADMIKNISYYCNQSNKLCSK